jgi:curved DNA-binding protein CbpA
MSEAKPADDVDLTLEERADIDGMYLRLATSTWHELLGVDPAVDRRALRAAYFALTKRFHPDAYFGRRMGPWKGRVEEIFREVTRAYEVLSHSQQRVDYDASRAARSMVPSTPPPPPPSETTLRTAREALARKLRGGGPHPGGTSSVPPPAPDPLQSLYAAREARAEAERSARLQKLLQTADEADARHDLAAATDALASARALAPEDSTLAARADAAARRLAAARSETWIAQAERQEREERWTDAAASWQKAWLGRPDDAILPQRAALALVHATKDLPRAAELARRATQLAPDSADAFVVLARVFLTGGLRESAHAALEAAARLAPDSRQVKDLRRQLKG